MRAVIFKNPGVHSVDQIADPVPGAGAVLLRTIATGACGSDLHLLAGHVDVPYPMIPGHEIVAEVAALGEGVENLSVGEVVAVDNTEFCNACVSCRNGRYLYCENFFSLGRDGPGGFADYLTAQAGKCFLLNGLDPFVGVFTEPLACAIHGLDRLDLDVGSDVLVFGAGPSGLLLAQLLAHGGAARVTVAAPTEHKLELARQYGIDQTVTIDRADIESSVASLRDIAPDGFDAVVDATGSVTPLRAALGLTRMGGTILVYGMVDSDALIPFSPYDVFSREITIRGTFAQTHCFERALRALTTGRVKTDGMITDIFGIEDFPRALEKMTDSNSIKVIVAP